MTTNGGVTSYYLGQLNVEENDDAEKCFFLF